VGERERFVPIDETDDSIESELCDTLKDREREKGMYIYRKSEEDVVTRTY
jgi:hypothetical protein